MPPMTPCCLIRPLFAQNRIYTVYFKNLRLILVGRTFASTEDWYDSFPLLPFEVCLLWLHILSLFASSGGVDGGAPTSIMLSACQETVDTSSR